MRVRHWATFVVPCLVVSLFLVLGPVHLHQARAAGVEEQRLLELINSYRQENGIAPLVPSGALSTSATRHSEDIAAHDFFSHDTRESSYYPSGSNPAHRTAREGYPTSVYTAAGIGHVDTYWTADFGSVADTPLELETLQTNDGRLDKPTAGERNSTPPSATEQATGKREGDGQPTVDERTPEEQAQLEGTQPEAQGVTVEDEPVAGETENIGQTPTQQQATVGQ